MYFACTFLTRAKILASFVHVRFRNFYQPLEPLAAFSSSLISLSLLPPLSDLENKPFKVVWLLASSTESPARTTKTRLCNSTMAYRSNYFQHLLPPKDYTIFHPWKRCLEINWGRKRACTHVFSPRTWLHLSIFTDGRFTGLFKEQERKIGTLCKETWIFGRNVRLPCWLLLSKSAKTHEDYRSARTKHWEEADCPPHDHRASGANGSAD